MSKRHPGTRRVAHGPSDDAEDAFIARILGFSAWAKGNQQLLTVVAVIGVLAVLGGMYFVNYRSQLSSQAAQQLEAIHQSISIADTEGAKIDLATFLDRFGGTVYEGEARMVLGELYLQSDDSQQAIAVLAPIGASPRSPVEFQAASLLGAAYEQEERWDEAEDVYMTIASRSDLNFQVQSALASAARIRASQGDTEGAIELYERVLAELDENAPERGVWEMRIQEIRSAS